MNKRDKTKAFVAGLLIALSGVLAGGAWAAGIADTRHNLSTSNLIAGAIKSTDQTEICIFCHTPHAAIKNNNIPLWNHTLSTVATYGVYTSPTFNGAVADGGDVADVGGVTEATAAVSNLCLSCHDGTLAVNNLSNPSNGRPDSTFAGDGKIPAGAATNLGSTADALKNDHPVNFTYDAALVTRDGNVSLKAPTALTGVKLFSNKVQCASCHDPHVSQDPTGKAFLRVSMAGSSLCLACHTK